MAKHSQKAGTEVWQAASYLLFGTWQTKPHLVCVSQVQLPQLAEGTNASIFFPLENPHAFCWEDQLRGKKCHLKLPGPPCPHAQIMVILS